METMEPIKFVDPPVFEVIPASVKKKKKANFFHIITIISLYFFLVSYNVPKQQRF